MTCCARRSCAAPGYATPRPALHSGMAKPEQLLRPTPAGLYCPPGDFYIDPVRPVDRAVITHGHADHARSGHGAVLATAETLAIMATRYGEDFAGATQTAAYGKSVKQKDVTVTLVPAGHVLGSAQAVVRWQGLTMVVSGDYKRRRDPTCAGFEPVKCDVFISEATFGLPVFRHPPDTDEMAKLAEIGGAVSRALPPRRRLRPRQGAAHHLPAARGRLRQDDLRPRRIGKTERALRILRRQARPAGAGHHRRQEGLRRRHRHRAAERDARPLVAALSPIPSSASPRAGCGCAPAPARVVSNCR